jgi:hypothetical protein
MRYSKVITENLLKSEIFSCSKFFQIKPYISISTSEWSGTEFTITEATTGLLYQPQMMDDDECGPIDGMLGRGNRSTQKTGSNANLTFIIPY